MFPEAGGSSSFARHAFNEFWSFFAAWGQMLNYVITISISAFFVPHYLGSLFWEPLRHGPGDVIGGIVVVVVLAVINVFGVKEAARLNILLAVTDFATQLLLVLLGIVLVFSPETLIDNVHLGLAPSWKDFVDRDPGRDDRLHRHRDDLEHGRGGERRGDDDPARDQPRRDRRVRDLRAAAGRRAERAAGHAERRRRVPDAARPARGQGRLRRRPGAGDRQAPRARAVPGRRRAVRRPAGGDDPLHRDERRHHRRLAARLLDGDPPPGARPAASAAPALPHAVAGDPDLLCASRASR